MVSGGAVLCAYQRGVKDAARLGEWAKIQSSKVLVRKLGQIS